MDLELERRTGEFIRKLIEEGVATAVHDISDGGLLVALAEMALAGGIGAKIAPDSYYGLAAWAFGEDQASYLITTTNPDPDGVVWRASECSLQVDRIGRTEGSSILIYDEQVGYLDKHIPLSDLRRAHEGFFPNLMGSDAALA